MPAATPIPVLHVHPPPAAGPAAGTVEALRRRLDEIGGVDQGSVAAGPRSGSAGADPIRRPAAGLGPRGLRAVARALRRLVAAGDGQRRSVQWPVPDRWPVVHAHGVAAVRASWVAAALVGSGARLLARPIRRDDGGVAPGPWRKADRVAPPDRETAARLARLGVERRRIRTVPPDDAEATLRLYRRLAGAERRRVQRVDWRAAE